jgi:hypothetical protein
LRPVKAPPARTTISHRVLAGWSAARLERRGRAWKSTRELALDPERWSVTMRCERGYTQQLPDLVGWVKPSTRPDERVVRRHVAKLEDAGWLVRAPWIWGEGSVVWLTSIGTEIAGNLHRWQ